MHRLPRPASVGTAMLCFALSATAFAQATVEGLRSHYNVDGTNAWIDESRAQVPLLPPAPVVTPVAIQALGAGAVWSQSDAGQGWIGRTVALGQFGELVFSEFDTATDRAQLVSGIDAMPLAPLWSDPQVWTSQDARVEASAQNAVFVSCRQIPVSGVTGPRNIIITRYGTANSTPNWTYQFPVPSYGPARALVSRDGSKIMAGMLDTLGALRLAIFDPFSGVPVYTATLPAGPQLRSLLLSDDGSTLYWATSSTCTLWDVATRTTIATYALFNSLDCHAISGNGRVFAYGGFNKLDIFERQAGGGYAHIHQMTLPGQTVCGRIDISADGSTLVAGFNHWDFNLSVTIQALDIPSRQLTMSETVTGAGTFQNIVSDIAVADDGQRFVVGLWGDELGLVPELRLYRRFQNTPVHTYDYPGSVYDVDISSDGSRVVAGTKAVHANTYAGGGSIELYRFEDEDFVVKGIPRLGDKVRFTLGGSAPLSPCFLINAPRPGIATVLHGIGGALYLDRTTMVTRPIGVADANGQVTYQYDLPTSPSSIGVPTFFQGFTLVPRQFSESWMRVTVLP
ncbi:MAG: hypothetical protein JNL28_06040 [Planctomycetes bacterium]|nr:hypothetical protein [Planctomycetota bacterium]